MPNKMHHHNTQSIAQSVRHTQTIAKEGERARKRHTQKIATTTTTTLKFEQQRQWKYQIIINSNN